MEETTYTMRQVSKMLGVSSQKLRRYCNAGLVSGVRHSLGRHRQFSDEQVDWLRMLNILERAGFSTQELRKFLRLRQDDSEQARREQRAMLTTHKHQIRQKMVGFGEIVDFLERQEELLETVC